LKIGVSGRIGRHLDRGRVGRVGRPKKRDPHRGVYTPRGV